MPYTTYRAEIVTLLQAVANVGVVHNRDRWSDDWPSFLNLFKTTIGGVDQVRGWMVTREAKRPDVGVEGASTYGKPAYENVIVIRGILGLSDADDTEGTFQDLVDAIVAALNADTDLNGNAVPHSAEPATVRVIDLRVYGTTLCHYAEIEWSPVTEEP